MTNRDQDLIERLKEAAAKATPGPWHSFYKSKYQEWHVSVPADGPSAMKMPLFVDGCPTGQGDAEFIALCSPDNILSLLECLATLQSELDEARGALKGCHWYWPADDTSSEMCGDSAQEIVQNAYDWTPEERGDVIEVARGGIVEVTYCASLPPADDADSDDDFWVQEATAAEAQAKIDAELARRAATRTAGGDNGE